MSETEIFQQVVAYLSEQLVVPAETIAMTSSFKGDLNADSLRLIEMALHIEDVLKVRIDETELKSLETVGDVVRYVASRTAGASGGQS